MIWWRHVLVPVIGAAITMAASGAVQVVVGAVWLVAGLGVLLARRGR